MKKRIIRQLKRKGVVFTSTIGVNIEDRVEIEEGVIIEDNVTITGDTHISRGAFIGRGTHIESSYIGSNVCISNSKISHAYIGDRTTVGPYAHIHSGSKIGEGSRVGNFVEIKNSNIGHHSKMAHLAYIGDADIGHSCNIGCGAIFVNYDGVTKRRSTIGNKVFVGSNVNVIAPVVVADGAYIAAGSTLTIDLAERDMCIARAREVVKPNKSKYFEE